MKVNLTIIVTLLLAALLSACQSGVYHTVQPGQTLYRISRTYQIEESRLARVNGISDPTKLRSGTRLFIPGAERERSVAVISAAKASPPAKVVKPVVRKTTPAGTKKTTQARAVVSAPKSPTVQIAQKAPVVQKAPAASKAPAVEKVPAAAKVSVPVPSGPSMATSSKLQWPIRGKILRTFSTQGSPGAGKGIEIAANSGSGVAASEAGKVIYSGDGVKGYGFLIILQHENDLFTIYGFNQKNLVKLGEFVSRGERIALSGAPPGGGAPRLHFEVRKGKQAVDPILYLP